MSRQYTNRRKSLVCLVLIAIAASQPVLATPKDPAQHLVALVEAFVERQINDDHPDASRHTIEVNAPDRRLDLATCGNPTLSLHSGDQLARRVLVRARCTDSFALHLPVDLEVFKPVLVARTAMARHAVVGPEDIESQEHDVLSTGRHFLSQPATVIGQRLKRAIPQGKAFNQRILQAADVVSRGDQVVIVAWRGDLQVRMQGTALASGARGEQIRVRNASSARIIKGEISAPGEIRVHF